MSIPITCPSGLEGEFRKFKTKDFSTLADKRLNKQKGPVATATVCKDIWTRTTKGGIYELDNDGNPPWLNSVIEHDRFYLLMQARINGPRGPLYDADFQCMDEFCDARIPWTVDLSKLEVRPISDDARVGWENGNRFEIQLPVCKRHLVFQLPTFDVQKRIAMEVNRNGQSLESIYAGKILEVEDLKARSQFHGFIADLDAEDWEYLDDEIQEMEFGVNTEIEIECPDCDRVQTRELILGTGFLFSRTGDKRASRRRQRKQNS